MRLMLCGLSAGLDMPTMREMRTTDVANIVSESTAISTEAQEECETEATQEDVDWLKGI